MPKDIRLLTIGLKFAEKKYGSGNIAWPKDFSWIYIDGFKLPENFRAGVSITDLLILVPENYGYGGCFRDIFMDPELELLDREGTGYRKLGTDLHGFREFPYPTMTAEQKKVFRERSWAYLCLHDGNPDGTLTSYLDNVSMYLAYPYKDWKSISTVYKK